MPHGGKWDDGEFWHIEKVTDEVLTMNSGMDPCVLLKSGWILCQDECKTKPLDEEGRLWCWGGNTFGQLNMFELSSAGPNAKKSKNPSKKFVPVEMQK